MLRLLATVLFLLSSPALAAPTESWEAFLRNFEPKAIAAGVTPETWRLATDGLTPDPNVPDLVVAQPEFTTPIWEYLDVRINDRRITHGQAAMKENDALFQAVGQRTGVDPYILGAIWGVETDFGSVVGDPKYFRPIIRSLATLVHQHRSRFEGDQEDFIAALLLLQRNHMTPDQLIGSWAGAIGHLQVNPSNVIAHGSDGDGDGIIDLNNSLSDALATSAKYLLDLGYQPGLDWGFEVEVPASFDYLLATRDTLRPVYFFAERGVRRVEGRPFKSQDTPVFLYAPAGAQGPKFLLTSNYLVFKGYNFSDSYALTIGHLTDRLKGNGEFVASWPRDTKFPNLEQRQAIQRALSKLGLYDSDFDGRVGPITQAAYAKFQASKGQVADGFVTLQSYEELMAATQ